MDNSVLISQHNKGKEDSLRFKERRFNQWNENYALYRDKVSTNRLTQRQPINIPIMRETIQTWISKSDEAPQLKFETRGQSNKDKSGEILLNTMWDYTFDDLKLDLKDNLEKKIVGLQGRGFKKWGFSQGKVFCDLIDPYDVDIDPRVNPLDVNTASFINHKHIFRPLRTILANPKYNSDAKQELKTYLDTKEGLIKAATSQEEFERREERLRTLGANNFDELGASDVLVEITESYRLMWDKTTSRFVRHLIVIALDQFVLYNKPIKEAIGTDLLPIVTWADDPDANDFWSDGKGDNVRTFNKVANMYISQDIENRAYRNFGMYFFNTMNGTFQPRAFEAKPFGMYGVPGNPQEIVQQMRIEPLGDTTHVIEYMKNLIQSSVAQTATERGEQDPGKATLGEVQLTLQQSQGRQAVGAKQYRTAWRESGQLFYELLNANSRGGFKMYKKGNDGNYYNKTVSPSDWQNPEGYECKVVLESESQAQDDMDLKKTAYIKQSFINNPVAQKIARRKELELLGWEQEEIEEVMQYEDQGMQQQAMAGMQQPLEDQQSLNDTRPVIA